MKNEKSRKFELKDFLNELSAEIDAECEKHEFGNIQFKKNLFDVLEAAIKSTLQKFEKSLEKSIREKIILNSYRL